MFDYSTLSRRQKTLRVAITARASQGGLHRLVDNTGVKILGEGDQKIKKYSADYRRQQRKVHFGVDAQTLEIQAIEVPDNAIGDAPMQPQLLAQTPEDELLRSIRADGNQDTKAIYEAIAHQQDAAIIPTHKNARPQTESRETALATNDILRATCELGRLIWKKSSRAGDGSGLRASDC